MNQEPVAARARANDARSQEQPVPTFIRLSSIRRQRKFYLFIYSRLIQARRAGEKRLSQRVFCLHLIIFSSRTKGCFISFSKIHVPEFLLFLSITSKEPKKVLSVFSRSFQANIFIRVFFHYSITFIAEAKECKSFSRSIRKAKSKQQLTFSSQKFMCDYIKGRLRTS